MQLFRITTHELAEEQMKALADRIQGKLDSLAVADSEVVLRLESIDSGVSLSGLGQLPAFQLSQAGPIWKAAARAIAEFIVAELEPQLVEDMAADACSGETGPAPREEIYGVLSYCRGLLNLPEISEAEAAPTWVVDGTHDTERRIQTIARSAEAYLERETLLIIEGFLRFRLQSYLDELFETVDNAFEEYWSDRQYREFIALLKYFVYIQDTRIPMAHLLHRSGSEFSLLDERLEPIDPGQFDQLALEVPDMDIQFEDMIVSALLSVAPQQITLHTRSPGDQVVQTILNIFEPRARLCTGCATCQARLGPPIGDTGARG